MLRTPGFQTTLLESDGPLASVAFGAPPDLDGRQASGALWSKVFGRIGQLQGAAAAGNASQIFIPATALYALASGQVLGDTLSVVTFETGGSFAASGASIELWRGLAASGAATQSVRAKVSLGPSAAMAVALFSHDGTATTLHASVTLANTLATALQNRFALKLALQTLGGEGRVWVGTAAVGSPILNPSHANLALSGHPLVALNSSASAPGGPGGPQLKAIAVNGAGSAPDTDAREWFRFESDPQPRTLQGNASVWKQDMTRSFRGLQPKLPAVGSPGATAPGRMVVLTGQIDDFLGNDPFDVRVDCRERFSFLR